MGSTIIVINDPVRWFERLKWIFDHCKDYQDLTHWPAWQIGIEDIRISVQPADAVLYYLTWN